MTAISSCWEPAKALQCSANKAIPSAGKTGQLVEYLSTFKQNHQQRSDLNEEIMNYVFFLLVKEKRKVTRISMSRRRDRCAVGALLVEET